MRITCPTCKAVYEAPDEAIGAGGRVVECSDCGGRWMQPGPVSAAGAAEAGGDRDGERRMPGLTAAAQAMSALRTPEPGAARRQTPPEPSEPRRPIPVPPAPVPSPAASRIASPPAAQVASPPATQVASPMASPVTPPAGPAAPRRREVASIDARDLGAQLREAEAEEAPRRGAGRAIGFILALLISAGAAGAYLERERIAEAAPQAAPYLDRYAGVVDRARRAVDGAAAQVRGMIGG